jgi:hypothetical protein
MLELTTTSHRSLAELLVPLFFAETYATSLTTMQQPTSTKQGVSGQLAETNHKPTGKARIRTKPRHLSAITRQRIIEEFYVRESSEDVAEEFNLPVRCVDDVIKIALLKKPIRPEGGLSVVRRIA